MLILAIPVLAGAVIGWLRGGRFDALERLRFRAPGLVLFALAVQTTLHQLPDRWRVPLLLASYVAVGLWIARNLVGRVPALRLGLLLVALGWAMNLAAMIPNGGMPVSEAALDDVGAVVGYDVAGGHLSKHVATHGGPVDVLFGDSIPVPALGAVISLGDIVLALGIALTLSVAMTSAANPDREPVLT